MHSGKGGKEEGKRTSQNLVRRELKKIPAGDETEPEKGIRESPSGKLQALPQEEVIRGRVGQGKDSPRKGKKATKKDQGQKRQCITVRLSKQKRIRKGRTKRSRFEGRGEKASSPRGPRARKSTPPRNEWKNSCEKQKKKWATEKDSRSCRQGGEQTLQSTSENKKERDAGESGQGGDE